MRNLEVFNQVRIDPEVPDTDLAQRSGFRSHNAA